MYFYVVLLEIGEVFQMKNNKFSEEMDIWIKEKKPKNRDVNKIAFLAVQAEVKDALEKGYSVINIWEFMCEKKMINFGYDTFRSYVKRFKLCVQQMDNARKENSLIPSEKVVSERLDTSETNPVKKEQESFEIKGFTYNPIPNPDELF
jgi:hypothetical protein